MLGLTLPGLDLSFHLRRGDLWDAWDASRVMWMAQVRSPLCIRIVRADLSCFQLAASFPLVSSRGTRRSLRRPFRSLSQPYHHHFRCSGTSSHAQQLSTQRIPVHPFRNLDAAGHSGGACASIPGSLSSS